MKTKQQKKVVPVTKKKTVVIKTASASAPKDNSAKLKELERQNRILMKKLKKRGSSSGVNVEAAVKEASKAARDAALKEANKGSKQMQKQLAELLAENKKAKVKTIKARLMKQYGNRLIPALLTGETKEALETSAVFSHKAWKSAVRGAGVTVENDEDDEDTEDEEDEDEDEDEVDSADEEGEEDEDEEEDDELPPARNARAGANRNGNQQSSPHKKNSSRLPALPQMPSVNGRGGGVPRGNRNPMNLLNKVHTMSPAEYREHRKEVKAALNVAYPKQ